MNVYSRLLLGKSFKKLRAETYKTGCGTIMKLNNFSEDLNHHRSTWRQHYI